MEKKLFWWCEILVLREWSLLPEGRNWKSLRSGWQGSDAIQAHVSGTWRCPEWEVAADRLPPEWMMCWLWLCPWPWQQTRLWWMMWEWIQWWQCRNLPSSSPDISGGALEIGGHNRSHQSVTGDDRGRGSCTDGPGSETCFPILMDCRLPVRKSVIHLHRGSGTFSWESFSLSRAGMIVLKAVHKQYPGIGSWRVQMLEDEVEGHVYSIIYWSVSSVGGLGESLWWVWDEWSQGTQKTLWLQKSGQWVCNEMWLS